MSKRGKGSSGANLEPMTFVRKFGPDAENDVENAFTVAPPPEFSVAEPPPPPMSAVQPLPLREIKRERSRERERSVTRETRDRRRDDRSRSRERKRRRRSRSRSGDRGERRRRSRSRDRDREDRGDRVRERDRDDRGDRDRDREERGDRDRDKERRRRRSRSRSYERRRDRRDRDTEQNDVKPMYQPLSAQADNPLASVANALPPHMRASVVAQSLLVKPEALNNVINDAVGEAGVDLSVALPADVLKQQERERRRKSRWSTTKSFVPGMPTMLPSNLDEVQQKCYLRKLPFVIHKNWKFKSKI